MKSWKSGVLELSAVITRSRALGLFGAQRGKMFSSIEMMHLVKKYYLMEHKLALFSELSKKAPGLFK